MNTKVRSIIIFNLPVFQSQKACVFQTSTTTTASATKSSNSLTFSSLTDFQSTLASLMKFYWNEVSKEQIFWALSYVVESKRHEGNLQVNWEEEKEAFYTSPDRCQLSGMCVLQSQNRISVSS